MLRTLATHTIMTAATHESGSVPDCSFCHIARGSLSAVILYEDIDVIAFLDLGPIRPGHTQIIPRVHIATFELLPTPLVTKIVALGQQLASRMKIIYHVDRVAFMFTGGDVPHAHAHVIPMHEKTDVTSARYIASPDSVSWSSAHLHVDRVALLGVRDALAFTALPLP